MHLNSKNFKDIKYISSIFFKNLNIKIFKFIFSFVFLGMSLNSLAQDPSKAQAAPNPTQLTEIAFLGNSLTLHAPLESIGWNGNFGMAASTLSSDYTHVLLEYLKIQTTNAYIRNTYPFEVAENSAPDLINSINNVKFNKNTFIIIQLGDNVKNDPQSIANFKNSLSELINHLSTKTKNIFCISTWWKKNAVDAVIQEICTRNHSPYIFIGDIMSYPGNPDRKKITYPHPGVNSHPQDWEMKQIAKRVFNVMKLSSKIYFTDTKLNP